jgi:2,3,4,5-tetrahydropyridine-2-carboxylate N-succinyltransferase
MSLRSDVEALWHRYAEEGLTAATAADEDGVHATLEELLHALETGTVRAAEPTGDAASGPDGWTVNEWVKRGVLLNFGLRRTVGREYGGVTYHDVLPLRRTDDLAERGTRNTPDGTVVRRGAHVGGDCILMSPSFVNVGAHVGDGSLVDSCDTVGSCAQIGSNVKLGANTLVGGVLEPVEDAPVILEDGVSLGAGCRVTSGFHVGENTVVGENTLLSPRLPVYDLVDERVRYGHLPADRRAFTRHVESSLSDHELFAGGAYKPAVVALDVADETRDRTRREEALRE